MPARAGREAPRARLALAGIRGGLAERELVGHRLAQREPDALPGGAAVAAHAAGRERGDRARERLRLLAGAAGGDHAVGEAEREGLARVDRAAGEDQVEGPGEADQLRQADGAPVDQRHAPAAAEDAEDRAVSRDPQVAHERELEAARHRVALDRGDGGLGEGHAGRAHRPVALGPRVSPRSVPRALRSAPAQKTPPAPQSTATRSESSASNSRKASVSARAAGPSTALRASGRSITIVATVSLRSIRMAMVRSPAAGPRPGSAAPSNLRLSALRGQPGRKAGLQWAGRHARGGADSVAVRRRLRGVRGLRPRALAALAGRRGARPGARPGLRHRSEPAAPVAGVGRDRPRPVLVVAAAGPAPCARGAAGRGERGGPSVPRRVLRHGAERPRLL